MAAARIGIGDAAFGVLHRAAIFFAVVESKRVADLVQGGTRHAKLHMGPVSSPTGEPMTRDRRGGSWHVPEAEDAPIGVFSIRSGDVGRGEAENLGGRRSLRDHRWEQGKQLLGAIAAAWAVEGLRRQRLSFGAPYLDLELLFEHGLYGIDEIGGERTENDEDDLPANPDVGGDR
jgi:hypothetical protein